MGSPSGMDNLLAVEIPPHIKKCPVCEKQFKGRGDLKKHTVIHSDMRPFSCQQCDKAFKFPQNRNKHMITHTGMKDFKCDMCGKLFAESGSLKGHMKWHLDCGGEKVTCLFFLTTSVLV